MISKEEENGREGKGGKGNYFQNYVISQMLMIRVNKEIDDFPIFGFSRITANVKPTSFIAIVL